MSTVFDSFEEALVAARPRLIEAAHLLASAGHCVSLTVNEEDLILCVHHPELEDSFGVTALESTSPLGRPEVEWRAWYRDTRVYATDPLKALHALAERLNAPVIALEALLAVTSGEVANA